MKTVKYIVLLVVLVFVGDRAISFCIDKIYQDTYTGQSGGKINYLLDHYNNMSILAVGNSRCAHHIIPENLSKSAYNLSHNGMSLVFHVGIVDQLLNNENIKIDTILFHIEQHDVFSNKIDNLDIQHLKYYYHKNKWIKEKISKLSRFENVKYMLSSYRWNGKVMSVISNRLKTHLQNPPIDGYVPYLPMERDSINVTWSYNNILNTSSEVENYSINKEFKDLINHLNNTCKENNVELILFTSPIYKPEDLNNFPLESINTYFKNLGIPYYNYYDAYDNYSNLQSIWNWRDAHHLNSNGASILTDVVKEDIRKYK